VPTVITDPAVGGVVVTLPYPSGTGASGYDFVVAHRKSDGTVEIFEGTAVTKASNGLQVRATSLSPFAVSWKETAAAAPTATPAPATVAATGDTNPITLLLIILGVLAVALVVVLVVVINKRKKNSY